MWEDDGEQLRILREVLSGTKGVTKAENPIHYYAFVGAMDKLSGTIRLIRLKQRRSLLTNEETAGGNLLLAEARQLYVLCEKNEIN